jgi:pectate lyase
MKRFSILMMALVLGMALVGCDASTANIQSAQLAKGFSDNKAVDPTTTFGTGDTFHCVINVANAPEDTKVKAVWTAVDSKDAEGTEIKDYKIDEAEFATKDIGSVVHVTLSPPSSGVWPTGSYKVDIYLNGKLDRTLDFTVQ